MPATSRLDQSWQWIKVNHGWLLILFCLFLFTTKNLYNIAFGLMAILGLLDLCRGRVRLDDPGIKMLGRLFCCLWIPLLISLVDAVNFERSIQTVGPYVRYFFAGVYILQQLKQDYARRGLLRGAFFIITFWCLDALLQYFRGTNILGYPQTEVHLTGLFYPKLALGIATAPLIPIYAEAIRRYQKQAPWLWLAIGPFVLAVILSANRNSWFMLGLGLLLYSVYLCYVSAQTHWRTILAGFCIILLVFYAAVKNNELFHEQLENTTGLFSDDYETVNLAVSLRLPLWETALDIASSNAINGIGPRGFRYAYKDYADENDYYLQGARSGAAHPHQLSLEVAAETGMFGVIGMLIFWWFLIRYFARKENRFALPWFFSIIVALFPLNAHLALYSSYWSSYCWWLIAVGIAMSMQGSRLSRDY